MAGFTSTGFTSTGFTTDGNITPITRTSDVFIPNKSHAMLFSKKNSDLFFSNKSHDLHQ